MPTVTQLERMARKVNRPKITANVSVWMDSTDCRITGKASISRKDSRWSYKLNSPGNRWNVAFNAKGVAFFISGPWKPKLYDADIVISTKDVLESSLEGASIIGDCHYSKCKEFFTKITFITPYSEAGRPKIVAGKKVPFQLDAEKKEVNEEVYGVRGKAEAPFGWLTVKFRALDRPFGEDDDQHDCLFRYGLAIHKLVIEG